MPHRSVFRASLLVGLALAAAGAMAAAPGSLRPGACAGCSVLVVTLDTTRADHLGCYGDAKAATPAIDALAAEGIRFTRAFASAPVTLPSHATLFTGLYPPRHGARGNAEFRLDPRVPTAAEAFRGRGYETAAFVSSFVLDARSGLDRGFDTYDDRVAAASAGAGFPPGTPERRAAETADAFLGWLGRRPPGKPFFAWLHFFDPHAPYEPPQPFASRFAGRPYDGEIASMDAQLARVRAALERSGAWERLVVAVAGDHGESLGEHGERTHGIFLYDAVLRVPLILRVPGSARASVDGRLVSLADVFPTLAAVTGVPTLAGVDGRSLAGAGARADAYMESLLPWLDFGWAPMAALRGAGSKYVLAPRPEYYDLEKDPAETRDLSGDAGVAAARTSLSDRLRRFVARATLFPEPSVSVRPEDVARLQALGYASGAGPSGRGGLADPKDKVIVSETLIDANAELSRGRASEALALLDRLEGKAAGDRSVLHARAKALLRLGRYAEAEKALRAYRAIRPKADVSLLIAQILILRNETQEAEALLDEAERLDPRHGGVLIARGDLLARRGETKRAAESYRRAAEIDPYRAAALAKARLAALK